MKNISKRILVKKKPKPLSKMQRIFFVRIKDAIKDILKER